MKLNKLMLGLAFVACAGLVMTSCKKKGEKLTVEEARAAFIEADEVMKVLQDDIAAEPAIKIIDKLLADNGAKSVKNEQAAVPFAHISLKYYQDFFFYWKDRNLEPYEYEVKDGNGNVSTEIFYGVKYEDFPQTGDTAIISWENITDDGTTLSAKATIFYPTSAQSIFTTTTCTLASSDRDNGDMIFTFNSTASGGKHFTIAYNNTVSDGVTAGGVTVGAGSYMRMLFVQRNVSETVYSLKDIHGQAALGLFGKDRQELRWGNIKVYIDATTKITKDTKIEIYSIESKERIIGKLDAVNGIITYEDGGQTGQASVDMPKLYEHLKAVFNL